MWRYSIRFAPPLSCLFAVHKTHRQAENTTLPHRRVFGCRWLQAAYFDIILFKSYQYPHKAATTAAIAANTMAIYLNFMANI